MDEYNHSQVELIREAFYYQSRFDGTTMVFKIDYPVTEHPNFPCLMKDIALLAQTGIRVVIVPGAREWIDSVLQEYDLSCEQIDGLRITSEEAIPFVKMAAFDVATHFITALSASRVDALIGNFVRARGLGVRDGVDFLRSGAVDRIHTAPLRRVLDLGMVPILPCIGWSAAGKAYNLSSDEIALSACSALGAVKFFLVSADDGLQVERYTVPEGLRRTASGRVERLTPLEARALLNLNKEAAANDRAMQELELAIKASRDGVERVHLVDSRLEGAILRELFSNLGVGTMVYTDEYESIRPAVSDDIPEMLALMEDLMARGVLLRRNAEDIAEKLDDYIVFDTDNSIRASAALHDWGEGQTEIAALVTDPEWIEKGLGRRMVRYMIEQARKRSARRVFVLTTSTQDWFETLGFVSVPAESLPERKRAIYDKKRQSRVFALEL